MLAPVTTMPRVSVAAQSPQLSASGRPIARVQLRRAGGSPVVLTVGEMTAALFYCGTRLTWKLTADEVAALVLVGLDRIGLDQVRRIDEAHRTDGLANAADRLSDAEYNRRERRRWTASEGGEQQRSRALCFAAGLHRVSEGEPFRRTLRR